MATSQLVNTDTLGDFTEVQPEKLRVGGNPRKGIISVRTEFYASRDAGFCIPEITEKPDYWHWPSVSSIFNFFLDLFYDKWVKNDINTTFEYFIYVHDKDQLGILNFPMNHMLEKKKKKRNFFFFKVLGYIMAWLPFCKGNNLNTVVFTEWYELILLLLLRKEFAPFLEQILILKENFIGK